MNNLSSYFELVDAKIRASVKELPVCHSIMAALLSTEVPRFELLSA